MGHLVFVPGLQGIKALAEAQPATPGLPTNEAAMRDAAEAQGWDFHKFSYQSVQSPAPLLSAMEQDFADRLARLTASYPGEPVLIVASSVGFGVALGGLARLKTSVSPLALLGVKPVPDPLQAITLQIGHVHPHALDALKAKLIPQIPVPVEGTDGDHFPLTLSHVNDAGALRFLSNPAAREAFNFNAGGMLTACAVLYGAQDHLTPSAHMAQFRDAVTAVQPDLVALSGGHDADFTAPLRQEADVMMCNLG